MRQRKARGLHLENIKVIRGKSSSTGVSHLPYPCGLAIFTDFGEIYRLRRSLDNLTFLESLAIALVIGIGLGSIAHLIMMLFILSCRRLGLAIFSGARFGFGFRFPQCSREQMRTGEEAERKGEKETQKAITESDDRQMIEKKEEEQSRGQAEIKLSERDEVVSEGTRFEDECLPEYEEGEDAPFFKEKDLGV